MWIVLSSRAQFSRVIGEPHGEMMVGLPFIHLQLARRRRFDYLVNTYFATDNRNNAKGVIEVVL